MLVFISILIYTFGSIVDTCEYGCDFETQCQMELPTGFTTVKADKFDSGPKLDAVPGTPEGKTLLYDWRFYVTAGLDGNWEWVNI